MVPRSVAEAYHESTKYDIESLKASAGLNWANEPRQHRPLPDAPRIALFGDSAGECAEPNSQSLGRIGRLLTFTNGVTKVLSGSGRKRTLRAAPSAGGLYPTEIYLVTHDYPGIPDGVWNYQVEEHALARVSDGSIRAPLAVACADHPAVEAAQITVVLTAEFWRCAWRYQDRGYRRALLDTGHVMGNLACVARVEGWTPAPIGGFADAIVADLLRVEVHREGPLVVCPLTESPTPRQRLARATLRSGPPSRLGEGDSAPPADVFFAPSRGAEALHRRSVLQLRELSSAWPVFGDAPPAAALGDRFALRQGIALDASPAQVAGQERELLARRRSSRSLRRDGSIRADQLAAMLAFAYGADGSARPLLFDLSLLETYVAVTAVEEIPSGIYYYDPTVHELRLVARRDPGDGTAGQTSAAQAEAAPAGTAPLRRELMHAGLNQELCRDAAASVFHVCDLRRATRRFGDRAYRYAGLDAGHLGERIALAAGALGLGTSGIGGYLDDEVTALLRLPPSRAVIYWTVIGEPA